MNEIANKYSPENVRTHRLHDLRIRHNAIVGRYDAFLTQVNAMYGATHRAEVDQLIRDSSLAGAFALGLLDNCGTMADQLVAGVLQTAK